MNELKKGGWYEKESFWIQRFFFLVFFLAAYEVRSPLFADRTLADGTVVWAEWEDDAWYHGTIASTCDGGYQINYDDGDTKCCSISQIAIDEIPDANSIAEGVRVLAMWTDGKYYPGSIASISGESYDINYDDGDKLVVALEKIRLIGK